MVSASIFLEDRVTVMGIVNTTPDSFSDGGELFRGSPPELDVDRAVEVGCERVRQGAHVLDVGGESTRPGAEAVPAAVQIQRVVPVVEGLAKRVAVPISVDTRSAEVAAAALAAGARVVNDVSGLGTDGALAEEVARSDAVLILGHMRGEPATMRSLADYDDLFEEVACELEAGLSRATDAGVPRDRLVVDPGIGFSKSAEDSYRLLSSGDWFRERLGLPVLVGPSRKSFLGGVAGGSVEQRDEATWAACAIAAFGGASGVRVHEPGGALRAVAIGRAARGISPRSTVGAA